MGRAAEWSFIAFEPRFFPLSDAPGGGAIRPLELLSAFARMGADCHVVETERRRPDLVDGIHVHSVVRGTGKVRDEVMKPARVFRTFIGLARQLRGQGRRVCLWQRLPVVTFWKAGVVPVPARPFYLVPIARRIGVRTWVSIHDLSPDYEAWHAARVVSYGATPERQWRQAVGRWMERMALRSAMGADFVTTVSDAMADAVRERLGRSDVEVFRAGIRPQLVAGLSQWQPPAGSWVLGYVGSYLDAALERLTRAVAKLTARGHAVTVEFGTSEPDLLKRALTSDVAGRVAIRRVTYSDFPSFAERVNLWVVPFDDDPYYQMTWQLKPPMYVASGRPVVMGRTSQLKASGLEPFVFTAGTSVDELVEAIGYVMRNAGEAAARAAAGRAYVLEHLTWDQIAEGLLEKLEARCGS